MTLQTSPLDATHRSLGAKMTPFGGWEMPIQYPTGTLAEHRACRSHAAVFDVSHLGTVRVHGAEGFERLQATLTNDLAKAGVGRTQYTHLLDEADGSVLDDIIVWWLAEEMFDVMPNASNTDRVVEAVGGRDMTRERALLAIQGPEARNVLASFAPEAAEVKRRRVAVVDVLGVACTVAGTGYTGEDGVEVAVPPEHAEAVWEAVVGAGATPAGLGARDTLRLEMGLPLHGHELGPGITPLQAGLGFVVAWGKGEFRGRAALEAERERGVPRVLRGLVVEGRRPPRAGQRILAGGEPVGEVTSGNFSPSLEVGIALGFLPPDLPGDAELAVDIRGSATPARLAELPFHRPAARG